MIVRCVNVAVPLAAALALAAPAARAQDPVARPAGEAAPAPPAARPPEGTWPLPEGATLEVPAASSLYRAKKVPPRQGDPREKFLRRGGDIDASEALDEILDEVGADVARLGASRVSPILLERIQLSGNLDPSLASVVEARLAAALLRAADAVLVRCVECDTTHARVVDASWVVSRGITRREQALELARAYGTRSFLRVSLSATFDEPPQLALDVELVRADDAAIVYAESYRFGGENALLWRGADRSQTRQERLKELEEVINRQPAWSFAALGGVAILKASRPGANETLQAAYGALRIDERFGYERRHRISIIGGGVNHKNVSGGIVQAGIGTRLSEHNLWSQTTEASVTAGAFVSGGLGSSPIFAGHLEHRFGVRLGLQAMLGYLVPFKMGPAPVPPQDWPTWQPFPDDRTELGGLVFEAGVSIAW